MLETIALLALQGPPTALASSTSDTSFAADPLVRDESWFRRQEGAIGSAPYLGGHGLQTLLGDLTGDGFDDVPGDVDALVWSPRPGVGEVSPHDFLFSTRASTAQYEDGDLLRLAEGQGFVVEIAESVFLAAILPTGGSFDLDAATWIAADRLAFSVASDLTGTVLGDVLDGDVLVLDRPTSTVSRLYTEAQIQAFVDHATGGTSAVGDVLSLSVYPPTGELVFTIQSPSAADATVFGEGAGGRILTGWEESDWGFQQATELDALAFVSKDLPQPPQLVVDDPHASPGSVFSFLVRHGTPGMLAEGFLALSSDYHGQPGQGIGFFGLDPNDRWLRRQIQRGRTHPTYFDSVGQILFDWQVPVLPPGVNRARVIFQVLEHGRGWTPPLAIRVE